jgi:thymidine kinase
MARLRFVYGPMRAAKTANLLIDAFNYEQRPDRRVTVAKPAVDDRAGDQIATRAGVQSRRADLLITPELDVLSYFRELGGLAVSRLFVDEAQFLQPEQVDQLHELATTDDVPVDAYGLKTDFMGLMFPGSKRLIELASEVVGLVVPCMCAGGDNAQFNVRYVDGHLVLSGDQVAIEKGDVTYECLCSACYLAAKKLAESMYAQS